MLMIITMGCNGGNGTIDNNMTLLKVFAVAKMQQW